MVRGFKQHRYLQLQLKRQHKSKSKMLEVTIRTVITVVAFVIFCNLSQLVEQVVELQNNSNSSADHKEGGIITSDEIPSCTHDVYRTSQRRLERHWTKRMKIPVNVIIHSQDLIRYIFTKLHAPAVLMYGTLLNDIRNSATDEYDPCLHINPFDHDIAIAVYPIHLQQIATMKDQIYRYYRWEVVEQSIEIFQRGLSLRRAGQPEFRIDFYAFHYNETEKLIHFAWDGIKIERDAFLPLRKHKQMMLPLNSSHDTSAVSSYYIPNNPDHLLCNMYGEDYLTPKSGAKYGVEHDHPSYGNPECGFCC